MTNENSSVVMQMARGEQRDVPQSSVHSWESQPYVGELRYLQRHLTKQDPNQKSRAWG